jgi:hypothetical protein
MNQQNRRRERSPNRARKMNSRPLKVLLIF